MPISTRLAAILTTIAAVGTWVTTQQVLTLPPWAVFLATGIVTGVVAYESAENT